ncbi:putative inactive purple acid phosphatase 16 [Teratosphaeria destructans]|uniref:Inactive purple acid phosphatase 16 n=1 Tax=Teratosphaeria destructans TaxID=418781 RepID=A0A9W7SRI4_9PEZI|nr:putative inactive purple acid phosphatase 16 [Teratosphaeria destructans]
MHSAGDCCGTTAPTDLPRFLVDSQPSRPTVPSCLGSTTQWPEKVPWTDMKGRRPVWAEPSRGDGHSDRSVQMICALLIAVLLAFRTFAAPRRLEESSALPPLRFTPNGTFQISIFEDLHFGENAWDAWGPQQDINSVKVIGEVLDVEQPQLVVLNGDLITGENAYLENATVYVDQIVAPLVQRNLTWASTYGNHDSEFNLSRHDMLARERRYPNARTTQMVFGNESGVSNYYLPVYPSNGTDEPCLILWFFDSRGGYDFQTLDASGDEVGQPDWVDVSVVRWFTQTRDGLKVTYGRDIPSLAFVHIPTNASQALQTEAGVDPHLQPGINDDEILAQQAQGWCADGRDDPPCTYGGQDGPFMEALTQTPGLMGVFSGHDHGVTWCYRWDTLLPGMTVEGNGINLCFGQHSGYGGYGSWIRGARQILVTEAMVQQHEIDTWIRLESQDVVGAVTLNATYNHDSYPATDDTMTHCPTCNCTSATPMPGTS